MLLEDAELVDLVYSGSSVKHSASSSVSRASYSTIRPATHSGSGSVYSARTLVPPPRPQLCLDAQNASSGSLWRVPRPQTQPSPMFTASRMSGGSGATGSQEPVAYLGVGFGDLPEYGKLPLCVPRRVEPTKRGVNLDRPMSSESLEGHASTSIRSNLGQYEASEPRQTIGGWARAMCISVFVGSQSMKKTEELIRVV